uniref:C2H2-type domain-containing protein n=1 Tax=Leersia perrieri TaxID=77586 RepID=A0A0D9XH17_9ORYZ
MTKKPLGLLPFPSFFGKKGRIGTIAGESRRAAAAEGLGSGEFGGKREEREEEVAARERETTGSPHLAILLLLLLLVRVRFASSSLACPPQPPGSQSRSESNPKAMPHARSSPVADLPGWPLFSPPKLQLQKCTKCSREFCSSINYRRHTRVHRRTLQIEKDFLKNRDNIAAFWDRLTLDQAKTILSLADVDIEGVSGPSILAALTTWTCKPGYASLPNAYARAGNQLLDLIETTPSRLPVSSNELFSMLDEASENTFLCTNPTASIKKFIFNGEADKVATELKNAVACTSYMLEQKLVEAWSADKAAEALRCQKLLVEEEEAAQKKQAELIERKRTKKLRQKVQRLKDLKDEDAIDHLPETLDCAADSSGTLSLKATLDPGLYEQEDPQYLSLPTPVASEDNNSFVDLSVENGIPDPGHEVDSGVVLSQQAFSRHRLGRKENLAQNSFASGSAIGSKHAALARHSHYRGTNVSAVSNKTKTWAWKARTEIEEHIAKDELNIDDGQDSKESPTATPASQLNIGNNPVTKMVQPISDGEDGNGHTVHNDVVVNITPTEENDSSSSVMPDGSSRSSCCNEGLAEDGVLRGTMFSSKEAAAFLSQRWKEAITSDHVKLVLCPDS